MVATHIDERPVDIPFEDIQRRYPRVVSQHRGVSSIQGTGIDDLREAITAVAAELPLIGESWPESWLAAADALQKHESQYVTPEVMRQTMIDKGVKPEDTGILARWLHDLGDILYFQDDEYLDDVVMLNADWVTDHVYRVLDHGEIDERGIFTRDHMNDIWRDLDPGVRGLFLRLMEQFDLSYRAFANRDISIVVEKLSSDPPSHFADV